MTSSTLFIPSVGDAHVHRRIAGWTINCVFWHRTWVANGRPCNYDVADAMRQSHHLYHNKVKNLFRSQECERLNSIADSLLSDGSRHFWREARRQKGNKGLLSVINGASNPQCIAEDFKDDISRLFNSVHGSTSCLDDLRRFVSSSYSDEQWVPFLATDVSVDLKQLHADKMDADGCLCFSTLCKRPVSLAMHLAMLVNAIFFYWLCFTAHM